jgi:HPt (histidine-containing phosphotransfer) domain-containing protein
MAVATLPRVLDNRVLNDAVHDQTVTADDKKVTVFDKNVALARVGGLHDVLQDVLRLMVTESPKVHAEIRAALTRRDPVGLRRSAHTLMGSVSLLGATDLVDRLRRVEKFAAAEEFGSAADEIHEIDRGFSELQRLLIAELQPA